MIICSLLLISLAGLIGLAITAPSHDRLKWKEHAQHLRNLRHRCGRRNV